MSRDPHEHRPVPDFWRSRHALGLVVMGAVAAYFLLTEHLAHVIAWLPYLLLLLACPLMHLFMHGGHGHRHGGPPAADDASRRPSPKSGEGP